MRSWLLMDEIVEEGGGPDLLAGHWLKSGKD